MLSNSSLTIYLALSQFPYYNLQARKLVQDWMKKKVNEYKEKKKEESKSSKTNNGSERENKLSTNDHDDKPKKTT